MKQLIHRILFATDFSPSTTRTFQIALRWAESCDASLDIVHVMGVLPTVDLDSQVANNYIKAQEENSRSKLEALVSQAREKVTAVQSHLLEGLPTDEITGFALSSQADLVITGTHGWTGFDRVMMGSIAERVICRAPCPVLSVRDQKDPSVESPGLPLTPGNGTPKHLLLPLDFSECSIDAYEYGVNVAKLFDASVTLIHALEPFSYSLDFTLAHPMEDREHQEKVKSRLAELTDVCSSEGLTANYLLQSKPAAEAIIEGLMDTGADLIVMGTHGRQGLRRLITGNVAAAVLHRSPCPVLTVKSPKFKHESVLSKPGNVH